MYLLARWAAWTLLLGLFVLTVVPAGSRPVVSGRYTEHLLGFCLLGLAFAVAYRGHVTVLIAGLGCFCMAMEIVQLFVPTRHARWEDLVVNIVAVCAGISLVRILERAFGIGSSAGDKTTAPSLRGASSTRAPMSACRPTTDDRQA